MLDAGVKEPKVGEVTCNYCGNSAVRATGKDVYPHRKDLWTKIFFVCEPCDARVGCHPNTEEPLGNLANVELRQWRMQAHSFFDNIWKKKQLSRGKAYAWLRSKTGLDHHACHIGSMSIDQCKVVIKHCKEREEQLQSIALRG